MDDFGKASIKIPTQIEGPRTIGLREASPIFTRGAGDPFPGGIRRQAKPSENRISLGRRQEAGQNVRLGPVQAEPRPIDFHDR
jgi:hypothetical protein